MTDSNKILIMQVKVIKNVRWSFNVPLIGQSTNIVAPNEAFGKKSFYVKFYLAWNRFMNGCDYNAVIAATHTETEFCYLLMGPSMGVESINGIDRLMESMELIIRNLPRETTFRPLIN